MHESNWSTSAIVRQAEHTHGIRAGRTNMGARFLTFMRMPWDAATPVPTMTAVGVASPRAHGQAMTRTAMPNRSANRKWLWPAGSQSAGYSPCIPATYLQQRHITAQDMAQPANQQPGSTGQSALARCSTGHISRHLMYMPHALDTWARSREGVSTIYFFPRHSTYRGDKVQHLWPQATAYVRGPAHQQRQVMAARATTMGTKTEDT